MEVAVIRVIMINKSRKSLQMEVVRLRCVRLLSSLLQVMRIKTLMNRMMESLIHISRINHSLNAGDRIKDRHDGVKPISSQMRTKKIIERINSQTD